MRQFRLIAALLLPLALCPATPTWAGAPTLAVMEAKVRKNYDVSHLSSEALNRRIEAGDDSLLLIDVREIEEFAVSHLPGAVQVAPGVRTRRFLTEFADMAKGKTVVFYCSVGVRSSKLAERLEKKLLDAGAGQVLNLEGGLFRWHNESAAGENRTALVNQSGSTRYIHPYDNYWGELLTSAPALHKYSPIPNN